MTKRKKDDEKAPEEKSDIPWVKQIIDEKQQREARALAESEVEAALAPLRAEIAALEASTAETERKIHAHERDAILTAIGRRHDVEPRALKDFCRRASETWSLSSGNLVAVDADGIPQFSRELPGGQLLSLDEYMRDLRRVAPYYWKEKRHDSF